MIYLYKNQGTMEELMRKRCEEFGGSLDVLTDEEKAKLREEIEAEQNGKSVLDSVLDDPDIYGRSHQ